MTLEANHPTLDAARALQTELATRAQEMEDVRRLPADLAAKLGLDATSRVLLIGSEGVTDAEIFNRIMQGHNAA